MTLSFRGARFAAWKIYLCLIIPATILLNLTFPNFHAPDDYDHVKRAYTLANGPFTAITPNGSSTGAMIDSGLADYVDAQIPLVKFTRPLNPEQVSALRAADEIQWTGVNSFSEMPGALSYFPLIYAPQTALLEIGRLLGVSVETSVLWARFANGAAGIALAAIGLYLLRGGHALVLLLLLLPRTLLQFASNSADPILYGLAINIIALSLRTSGPRHFKDGLTAIMLFISSTVRPPIVSSAIVPGVQAIRERRWLGLGIIGGSCLASAAWMVAVVPTIVDHRCGNLGGIAPKISAFAWEWPSLIAQAFTERGFYYYLSFVGHFGWGDARTGLIGPPLPIWVYATALPLLALAIIRDLTFPYLLQNPLRISLIIGAFGSILLTFLAMFLACTSAGQTVIGGVQGRYFVTPLVMLAPAIAGIRRKDRAHEINRLYWVTATVWVIACLSAMLLKSADLYPVP